MARPSATLLAILAAGLLAVATVALRPGSGPTRADGRPRPAGPAATPDVTVTGAPEGRPIRPGFLGLGLEYTALPRYTGPGPGVSPLFAQLVRNLAPGQRLVLRIGGDSTDWTWWPLPGIPRPPWARYELGPAWVERARALASDLDARLLLGINLEALSAPLAAAEARGLLAGLPPRAVLALELGNEPELYRSFTWYVDRGRDVRGRPPTWTFADYTAEFGRIAAALPAAAVAGPATGGSWPPDLGAWLASVGRGARVRIATVHRFPLQRCYVRRSEPKYPTIAHLLSPYASTAQAASVKRLVGPAHARGIALRIGEMNTIGCGSADRVARSFASALWALDALFAMARAGVDGVNIQTYPGATFELFPMFADGGGRTVARVEPEYYGLLLFAAAAPPGSRLLRVRAHMDESMAAWATRAPDGTVRLLIINKRQAPRTLSVRLPAGATATATALVLTAPRLDSELGVRLGGESFGPATATGVLPKPPRTTAIAPGQGAERVTVPGPGAVLVTAAPPR